MTWNGRKWSKNDLNSRIDKLKSRLAYDEMYFRIMDVKINEMLELDECEVLKSLAWCV